MPRAVERCGQLYKKQPDDTALHSAVLGFVQSLVEDFKRQPAGFDLKIKLIKEDKILLENPRAGLARAINNAHVPFSVDLIRHLVDNFVKDVRNRANTL